MEKVPGKGMKTGQDGDELWQIINIRLTHYGGGDGGGGGNGKGSGDGDGNRWDGNGYGGP